jgi:hypothetical protein
VDTLANGFSAVIPPVPTVRRTTFDAREYSVAERHGEDFNFATLERALCTFQQRGAPHRIRDSRRGGRLSAESASADAKGHLAAALVIETPCLPSILERNTMKRTP